MFAVPKIHTSVYNVSIKGLKKVTKDMQTHKNPALRSQTGSKINSTPKPFSASKPAAPKPVSKFAAPKKEPVCELDGKKWKVS